MAICKFCGARMAWGNTGEKWVPLVPLGEESGLRREFQDENGNLRAGHRQICTGFEPGVRVAALARPVLPHEVLGQVDQTTGEIYGYQGSDTNRGGEEVGGGDQLQPEGGPQG